MLDEKSKVFSLQVLVVGELLLVTSEGTLCELCLVKGISLVTLWEWFVECKHALWQGLYWCIGLGTAVQIQ